MYRDQKYGNLDEIQNELSDIVLNLAPKNLDNRKIPFLSLGSDVGQRTIRVQGNSPISGDYIVEDVLIDNEKYRRLIFLNSPMVIQSEAKLKQIKTRNGVKEIIDLKYLTCKHHIYMCIGVMLASLDIEHPKFQIIGLGGGGLCSFLYKILPKAHILAIEIDEEMLKIATDWFGFVKDRRSQALIRDGIEHLDDLIVDPTGIHALLFDVDSKDTTIGMSCPPKQFLEKSTLDKVAKVIDPCGYFIINIVLRDENLRPKIIEDLTERFETIVAYKLEEDLNEIFICSTKRDNINNSLTSAVNEINKIFRKMKIDLIDKNEYLNRLEIVK